MGRGRAKAIQKKIARDLKYSSGGTDLDRLRAELTGAAGEHVESDEDDDEDAEDEDDLGGGD
jgi:hypothetical protein